MARSIPVRTAPIRAVGPTLPAIVVALSVLLTSPPVAAQGLGVLGGGGDPLGGELAEREAVTRTLDASYSGAQQQRVREVLASTGRWRESFDASPYVERSRDDFLAEVRTELLELEGDGSLTLAEVGEKVPPIRERHLNRFHDVLEARIRGFEPPPVPEEFGSRLAFVAEMARYTLLARNTPLDWTKLLGVALAGIVAAAALATLIEWCARRLQGQGRSFLASGIGSVRTPVLFAAAAGGLLVGLQYLWQPTSVESFTRTTLVVLIVAFGFWGFWSLCDELATLFGGVLDRATRHELGDQGRLIVRRVLRVLVLVVLVLVVTRVVLDASLGGLLAGLGIAGVAIYFLARGFIENLAASFTLFGDRPFELGDTVLYDSLWGTIEDIGFRSTRFRTFDGHLLTIPNTILIERAVHNVSARPHVRRRFRLSLRYGTPSEKVEEAIKIVYEAIEAHGDEVDREKGINVVFDTFGPYDLQLLVQYYTHSADYWEGKEVISRVNRTILHRFGEADIGFAFPTQTTVLETEEEATPALAIEGLEALSERLGERRPNDEGRDGDEEGDDEDVENEGGGGNGKARPGKGGRRRWRDGRDSDAVADGERRDADDEAPGGGDGDTADSER